MNKDLTGGDAPAPHALSTIASDLDKYEAASLPPDPDAWPDPLPLPVEAPVPPIPLEVFPPVLAAWSRAAASAMQVPEDSAAMLALASCGFALSGKVRVAASPKWTEGPNLYLVVVDKSGANKSRLFREAMRPIEDSLREHTDRIRGDQAEHDVKVAIARQRRDDSAKAAARSAKAATRPAKAADRDERPAGDPRVTALEAARTLAELEAKRPREPFYVASDATPEKIGTLLCEHRRVLWCSDEAEIFDLLTGRFGNKPNFDIALKAYDANPIRIDRQGRPALACPDPYLSLVLTVQPTVINDLAARPGRLKERGLTGRFVIVMPTTKVGTRRPPSADDPGIPGHVADAYARTVRSLLDLPEPAGEPPTVGMTDEAREHFNAFFSDVEASMNDGCDLADLESFASKVRGMVLRVALIFHAARGDLAHEIGGATMADAVRLGEYLLAHAKRANLAMTRAADDSRAAELWRYIQRLVGDRRGPVSLRVNDLLRSAEAKFPTKAAVMRALSALVDRGLVTTPTKAPAPGSAGGRPSETFMVNPKGVSSVRPTAA